MTGCEAMALRPPPCPVTNGCFWGKAVRGETCCLLHHGPAAMGWLEMSPLPSGGAPSHHVLGAGRPPRPVAAPDPPKRLPHGRGGDRSHPLRHARPERERRRDGEGPARQDGGSQGNPAPQPSAPFLATWRRARPCTHFFPPSLISALPGRHRPPITR